MTRDFDVSYSGLLEASSTRSLDQALAEAKRDLLRNAVRPIWLLTARFFDGVTGVYSGGVRAYTSEPKHPTGTNTFSCERIV